MHTLNRSKRLPANKAAIQMLRTTWVDETNRIEFPVDPMAIAEKLGIRVEVAPLDPDVAGLIVQKTSGEPVNIVLNLHDSLVSQRFTCAHELGHFSTRTDDPDKPIGFVDRREELASRETDSEEFYANRFAAELLMPAFVVRRWWAEGKPLTQIAKDLSVSKPALEFRLTSLGLI